MMRKWIWALASLIAVALPTGGAVWNAQPSKAADTTVKVDSEKFDPAEWAELIRQSGATME